MIQQIKALFKKLNTVLMQEVMTAGNERFLHSPAFDNCAWNTNAAEVHKLFQWFMDCIFYQVVQS